MLQPVVESRKCDASVCLPACAIVPQLAVTIKSDTFYNCSALSMSSISLNFSSDLRMFIESGNPSRPRKMLKVFKLFITFIGDPRIRHTYQLVTEEQ